MLVPAGVILLLVLLTALYVAAEFAAVGARRSRIRRLAEDGHPLASRALPVVEDPRELDRYIAASQVGITLSSLIAGAYAQASLAPPVAPLLARAFALEPESAQQIAAIVILAQSAIEAETTFGILCAFGGLIGITSGTLWEKRFGSNHHPIVSNMVRSARPPSLASLRPTRSIA